MRITSLAENTSVGENIGAEHGLSLFIETGKHNILFDMGQTELFAENAGKLGIDLRRVDIAVLSHGHYDHGGGLKKFLSLNDIAPVYMNRHAFEPHYNGSEKYIGLDVSLRDNARIIFTGEVFEIEPGLTLYACNERRKRVELGSFGLNMLQNGSIQPDDFRHEHYLLIEENNRKTLISGCSHKGILNIADWFSPDVMVGGFHFSKLPQDDTLKGYAELLAGFDTEYYTCHCTGTEQFSFMAKYMDRLHYLPAGGGINV
ncbi:MAG: MBL fold metallo-hydrolase [Oscillospiraceae bacterium]